MKREKEKHQVGSTFDFFPNPNQITFKRGSGIPPAVRRTSNHHATASPQASFHRANHSDHPVTVTQSPVPPAAIVQSSPKQPSSSPISFLDVIFKNSIIRDFTNFEQTRFLLYIHRRCHQHSSAADSVSSSTDLVVTTHSKKNTSSPPHPINPAAETTTPSRPLHDCSPETQSSVTHLYGHLRHRCFRRRRIHLTTVSNHHLFRGHHRQQEHNSHSSSACIPGSRVHYHHQHSTISGHRRRINPGR